MAEPPLFSFLLLSQFELFILNKRPSKIYASGTKSQYNLVPLLYPFTKMHEIIVHTAYPLNQSLSAKVEVQLIGLSLKRIKVQIG
jgi:hypothetical protein